MRDSVIFSRVMEEYGTHDKEEETTEKKEEKSDGEKDGAKKDEKKGTLMQAEERLTGAVSGSVYLEYFKYAGGIIKLVIIIALIICFQGSSGTSLSL